MVVAKIVSLNAYNLMTVILNNHIDALVSQVFVQGKDLNALNHHKRVVELLNLFVPMATVVILVRKVQTTFRQI